ncbi:uncharacterized protein LOC134534774 [Bacillus rossius redtenbacheri]|uniref:uncharacterized protein LOC134534774 n=1 Tax=Bacillus rossius redtenbacheri TaxID=93214 RepID=UPI002FDEE162
MTKLVIIRFGCSAGYKGAAAAVRRSAGAAGVAGATWCPVRLTDDPVRLADDPVRAADGSGERRPSVLTGRAGVSAGTAGAAGVSEPHGVRWGSPTTQCGLLTDRVSGTRPS